MNFKQDLSIDKQNESKIVKQFRRLLLFSGIFNISAATLFIFPIVFEYYLEFFNWLNDLLYLGGGHISKPLDSFHALFINTAGIDLVLIGSIVLLTASNPLNRTNRKIILLNGIGRTLFAFIIGYYAIYRDLIGIFVVIGIIDVIITVGFLYFLRKTKKLIE